MRQVLMSKLKEYEEEAKILKERLERLQLKIEVVTEILNELPIEEEQPVEEEQATIIGNFNNLI